MNKRTTLLLAGLAVLLCLTPPALAQVTDVENAWTPLRATPGDTILAERLERWRSVRLWHVAESGYLLSGFESRPGVHPWQGEHVGKWLHAATLAQQATGDARLADELRETVERLMAAQEPDGYLGTHEPAGKERFTVTPDNKYSWDVWSHRYNLYGLLTYERYHPDDRIVASCTRMADLLIQVYGPGKADIVRNGTRAGISSSTLLESMTMLYARTQEPRFLEFAEHIVACGENNPDLRLLGAMLDHEDVSEPGDGKAYQLMANLLGYVELFQHTGDGKYLAAAETGWENIRESHLLVTGGPWTRQMDYNGNRECFARAEHFDPAATCVETCCTTTWIQLSLRLFELTGRAEYAAEAEQAVLNHLLAAQDSNGLDWAYYTAANQNARPYETKITCCASSGPRALEMFAAHLAGETDGALCLASVLPCVCSVPVRASVRAAAGGADPALPGATTNFAPNVVEVPPQFGGGEMRVTGNFPEKIEIVFASSQAEARDFPLAFRPPWGARLVAARVNDAPAPATVAENGFHRIARAWKDGDKLSLEFECVVQSHIATGEGKRWVAFTYGPYALAQETRGEDALPEPFVGMDDATLNPATMIERVAAGSTHLRRFRIKGTDIELLPFYQAGSKSTGPRTYFALD